MLNGSPAQALAVVAARLAVARNRRVLVLAALPLLGLVVLAGLSACTAAFGQPVVANCDNPITAPVKVQKDLRGSTIVIASVMIQGHGPYALAVDTGASVSIVDRTVATQAGLKKVGTPEPVAGVGGSQDATPVEVTEWSVGQIRLPPMLQPSPIATLDLPDAQKTNGIVGLLGSDVLSRFGRIAVDYSNDTLIVYTQVVPSPTPTHNPRTPQATRPR
jgi:hypothetical protein